MSGSHRVSPPRISPVATRAARPPAAAAGSTDAYRQTSFVLGAEVDTVLDGLNLEGAIAEGSSGAKFRTQAMVAALGLWSRSWLSRLEALHAVEWGNYAAAVTLVRAAADYQASSLYILRTGAREWNEWLESGGIALAPDQHATEFRLHAFRAAEVLAANDILGPLYRTTMDLSLSHFGSTLLVAGNESAPDRVLMTFGDRDFHLGLAELNLGWLAQLGIAQADALVEFEGVFAVTDRPSLDRWRALAAELADGQDRCRIEAIEREGEKRYLVENWRREPRGAPRRLLL
jgi:hypothetical protein